MLTGQEVQTIENLRTRLLHVIALKGRKYQEFAKSSAMVSTCGKGGHVIR